MQTQLCPLIAEGYGLCKAFTALMDVDGPDQDYLVERTQELEEHMDDF